MQRNIFLWKNFLEISWIITDRTSKAGKPAIIGNARDSYAEDENYKIIGMLGQVKAFVSAENGEIRPGDSLTSASSTLGYVMRAEPGDPTVGVALEAFAPSPASAYTEVMADKPIVTGEGSQYETGVINVLISRRNKSLTVEMVESRITERIAAMEIEDDIEIHYILGQCYEALGRPKDALREYEEVFLRNLDYKDVAERISRLYASIKRS